MNVDFADEEMIAYRESLIEKKKEQPFWKKKCLSVNETAAYTGIGKERLQFYDDRRLSGVCHHRQICGIFK